MGLNDKFTSILGQILLMKPLPSLSQCYSLLLQEENQRSLANSSTLLSSDAISMTVRNVGTKFQAGKNVGKSSHEVKRI